MLSNRIEKWVEDNGKIGENQAGFRKGYSTVDNIFVLTSVAKEYIRNGKKLYAFFVDFKAAFDTIQINAIIYKLRNMGLSTKMVNMINNLYINNSATVWDGKNTSRWFKVNTGLRQGCVLSPLMFALFMEDLNDSLPNGIKIDNVSLKALMYADDIVLLADTAEALQNMIDKLEEYCKTWGLAVNTDKSKIMIFKKWSRKLKNNEKWK